MQREIKFRAMNYISHTWWYGSNQVDRIDYATTTMPTRTFWRWFAENALNPKTLMQYTGLKDKNGTEIYEGDMVKCSLHEWPDDTPVIAEINRSAVNGGYMLHHYWNDEGMRQEEWDDIDSNMDFEVIGNIWEHPELLKED